MSGLDQTLNDLERLGNSVLRDLTQSFGSASQKILESVAQAGAEEVDGLLIGFEKAARTKSATPEQLDNMVEASQLGIPLVKKFLPAVLKLKAQDHFAKKELNDAANALFLSNSAFVKEYQEMRAQEDYQAADKPGKIKDAILEAKERSDASGQYLDVVEKWENLKSTINKHCGLNLPLGTTNSIKSNYHQFFGLTIPK